MTHEELENAVEKVIADLPSDPKWMTVQSLFDLGVILRAELDASGASYEEIAAFAALLAVGLKSESMTIEECVDVIRALSHGLGVPVTIEPVDGSVQ